MYYAITQYNASKTYRQISAIFFISICFIFNCPHVLHADNRSNKSQAADEYFNKGQQERQNGSLDSALVFFYKALSLDPANMAVKAEIISIAEDYREKGFEFQQKKLYPQALNAYSQALELRPDNPIVFNDLGVLYEEMGMMEKAEELYLRSISLDSDYLSPYMNLAYLYKSAGKPELAKIYFKERYQRGGPNDPWREKAQKELFDIDPEYQGQIVQAEMEKTKIRLEEVQRADFNLQVVRANNHYDVGLNYMNEKNYEEALKEFDRALAITPSNPKVARAKEQVAIERLKDEVNQRSERAIELLNSGQIDSARQEFRRILTVIPNESVNESR
jgi:tetratricopeptide (TPR) repeat protein